MSLTVSSYLRYFSLCVWIYVNICLGQCGWAEVQCGINVHTLSKTFHPVSCPVQHCIGNCWPRALPASLWILLFIPWPAYTPSLSHTHYRFPDLFIYKLSHFYFQPSLSLLCLFSTPISQYVFLISSLLTFCLFLSLSLSFPSTCPDILSSTNLVLLTKIMCL